MIATCWASLHPKLSSLKKVGFVLLSASGFSNSCEQVFSEMKFILSSLRNSLTNEKFTGIMKQHQGNH